MTDHMEDTHIEKLRHAELETVRRWFKPGMRVLELGGGTGYQASILASWGCAVTSIDLADRHRPYKLFHPVQDYDGRTIPAPDASFDIVFSSNVLEHIPTLPVTFGEIRRVLKPGGLAIHLVPSVAWRFWSEVALGAYGVKCLLGRQPVVPGMVETTSPSAVIRKRGLGQFVRRAILLPITPHGEYPNALAELYYFSKGRWVRVFRGQGFRLLQATGTHLFYTGYALAPTLSLPTRRRLAGVLGSACHVFVMRPRR